MAASMLLSFAASAMGQNEALPGKKDAAVTYQWTKTNAEPGQCGCFSLNGGAVSASWNVLPRIGVVAEAGVGHAQEAAPFSSSLTLVSYLGGARYYVPALEVHRERIQPFAQLLVGASHAGGGIAGEGDGTYSFAGRIGGGVDLPLKKGFILRAVQLDYFSTQFKNGTNAHQNNFLLGSGVAYQWDPH